MAYVRSKMIHGNGPYYYLVKSERVGTKVKQTHIAYLGKNAGQKSGTATAATLKSVEGKTINTTYDVPDDREKPQETQKMISKEKAMKLGKAVGKVEDNGFNVMANGACIWHERRGVQIKGISITGETYPIKDEIKSLGGQFGQNYFGSAKGWYIPITDDNIDEVTELLEKHPRINGFISDR